MSYGANLLPARLPRQEAQDGFRAACEDARYSSDHLVQGTPASQLTRFSYLPRCVRWTALRSLSARRCRSSLASRILRRCAPNWGSTPRATSSCAFGARRSSRGKPSRRVLRSVTPSTTKRSWFVAREQRTCSDSGRGAVKYSPKGYHPHL